MIEVVVVGEGQTEETFIRDVLAPAFAALDISLQPRLISTSMGAAGGALSRDRVLRYLRNTLRQRDDTYVTTFFDLDKILHGSSIANCIGLNRIRSECPHFDAWLRHIEALRPLR